MKEIGLKNGWNSLKYSEGKDGSIKSELLFMMPFTKRGDQHREWNPKKIFPAIKLSYRKYYSQSEVGVDGKYYRSCVIEFINMNRMPNISFRNLFDEDFNYANDVKYCKEYAQKAFCESLVYLVNIAKVMK